METKSEFIIRINDKEDAVDRNAYLLNRKRTIWLGDVDETASQKIVSELLFLCQKSTEPIVIYINSLGGYTDDGFAILDAFEYSKQKGIDIVTVACGRAFSMGAFLLAAGTQGKRYATKNSSILLHQPLGGAHGQATDMKIALDQILKTKARLNNYFSIFTGKDVKVIEKDLERDYTLSAEEGLEYHIIDKIGFYEQ